jgi:hypothetical protein
MCRRPEPRPQLPVQCQAQQGLRQGGHVAGLDEQPLTQVPGQVREVPRSPADDREAEGHRLAPDGSVRLASCGQYEDIRRCVECRDLLRGERPVPDDATDQVALRKAGAHARLVPWLGRLVAGEVERPSIGWKPRERFEELENPFALQPVGDREEGGSPSVTQVGHRTCRWDCDIPSRRDDSNPRLREPCFDELLREVVAGGEQDVRST